LFIFNFEAFTTLCELHIDAENELYAQYIAHIISVEAKRLEQKYGFFLENSELYKINHRTSNTVLLDDEFTSLVKLSLFYYDKTLGAFDVTLNGTIKLEENQLIFSHDNTKIDFGGLVKEYAVDISIAILKDYKINSALVNFGGDLATIGTNNAEKWNIGIEDPYNENLNIETVQMDNNSLCSSGHSKRYKEINNKKISHIIVKEENNYQQISIIAPTTVDAGVWSTALLSKPSLIPPSHIRIVKKV
jgi:FAD:protein FMN transferase